MNQIKKTPIDQLGYHFIDKNWLPADRDEYYLRFEQNPHAGPYRALSHEEMVILVRNGNISDNWSNVLVKDEFDPALVQNCKFHGLVRIGKLEPFYLQFHDLRLPMGLYNSSIISCDIGDHVVINNVQYLSHYIIGNEVILVNVNEIEVTDHAKFGNGIIKDGEKESVRVWMELCNENAGRKVLPFDGMQPADAWIWTRFRSDEILQKKLQELTEKKFDSRRGYYGQIGDRTVIKNTRIVKDCLIGTDAYIKGANKLKNLTINSSADAPTQIGEGCEMVNGIIGYGCKAFYGVKAVRFILSSHSQLKYGARLINSFLGDNSTISCCEVLNSLIFPAHEQHHNNSFLCASLLGGQSNVAAGATIGSNHNSRSADGELITGRGFWPGLCVSLKHNSKFSSFTLLAKGDFPAELNIPIPFSLVSNDVSRDRLVVMPAYWFLYNMYALARNVHKYATRDKRSFKNQQLEYDFLAPDTINEMFESLQIIEEAVARSLDKKITANTKIEKVLNAGKKILASKTQLDKKEILLENIENSHRKVELIKVKESYTLYAKLIRLYGVMQLLTKMEESKNFSVSAILKSSKSHPRETFVNMGGQLMPQSTLNELLELIKSGKIDSWENVHQYYHSASEKYTSQKHWHGISSLVEILSLSGQTLNATTLKALIKESLETKKWMLEGIQSSREKDYSNPFRKMVYETQEEMDAVIGKLKDNSFLQSSLTEFETFETRMKQYLREIKA